MRRPIRVWKYRGWCWACRYGEDTLMPHVAGYNYPDMATALDAALDHLRSVHGVGFPK